MYVVQEELCEVTELRNSCKIAGFKCLSSDMYTLHIWEISQLS